MISNIIHTKYGDVTGIAEPSMTVFRGIPYAAPPVGPLRWKPPQEPFPWTGVRHCDRYAPMAIQAFPPAEQFEPYHKDFYFMGYPESSEDCLYLNVYTSADLLDSGRPVYLWFHGGGLSTGYSYELEFNPEILVKKGITVVQIGQRLNLFGFFSLPQLSEEQGGISGNYGLMDQCMALQWVVDNIEAFGGDPTNITAGGQSGGTQKACVLAASPFSRGHIRRIIAESGLKWKFEFPTVAEQEVICQGYLDKCGIDPQLPLSELRALDPWKLYQPQHSVPEQMVCDGIYIPCTQLSAIYEHYLGSVDFLCGMNYGEVNPYASNEIPKTVPMKTAAEFYKNYRQLLGPLYEKYHFEDLVKVTDLTCWDTARKLACQGLSAKSRQSASKNNMLNRIFGRQRTEKYPSCRIFSYIWQHVLPSAPEDLDTIRDPVHLGAYHSSELWYVFSSLRKQVPPSRPWRPEDYDMAELASSYWANFIRTGDVNGTELPYWPASGAHYEWFELKLPPQAHSGFHELDFLIYEYVCSLYQL